MTYTGVATKEPASASPTLDLVEWIVTGSKNAISDKARTIGAKSVVDTIACMLGALAEPGLNILTRTIRTHPDLPSSLIGFATAAAPSDAALINGMAAHMLDLDDGDFVSRAHPSCVILPTLLALGEARRSSGKALLDAFVTGWTVMQTIGAMVVPEMPKRGYHVTSAVGVIAAAAGAAKLLSFDCKKTATAMGIAASASAGIRANFGTDMKPYHAGCAAAAAVRAVELAEAGFTASTSILEATDGLIAVLVDKVATGRVRKHVDRLLNGEVRFEDEPPNIKFFAACHCVHAQIEGALKLRSKIEDLNSIRSIIVEGGTHTALYMIHSRPVTGLEAKFSMEGATAIALVDGAGGPNQFTDISINRPEVQKLLRKVTYRTHTRYDEPKFSRMQPGSILIETSNGVFQEEILDPRGCREHPCTLKDVCEKFAECANGPLTSAQISRAIYLMKGLPSLANLSELGQLLRGAAKDSASTSI